MKGNSKMKDKMLTFMQGRYGVDALSNFLMWMGIAIAVICIFLPARILVLAGWLLILYAYIRIFSKNISKRYAQNQKFLDRTWTIRNAYAKIKYRIKYGKQTDSAYRIYKCRKCGQKIRIPKGKGRIRITCPKCQYQFKKRS